MGKLLPTILDTKYEKYLAQESSGQGRGQERDWRKFRDRMGCLIPIVFFFTS